MTEAKFPHCDSRVLHRPGSCKYCDMYPMLQDERIVNNICFTGDPPESGKFPCPAEKERSLSSINAWSGNVARPPGEAEEDLTEYFKVLTTSSRLRSDKPNPSTPPQADYDPGKNNK